MFLLIFNSCPRSNFILFSIADKLNLRSSASLCMRIMYVINSSLCKRAIFPPLPMHIPSEMGRFTLSLKHKKQRLSKSGDWWKVLSTDMSPAGDNQTQKTKLVSRLHRRRFSFWYYSSHDKKFLSVQFRKSTAKHKYASKWLKD